MVVSTRLSPTIYDKLLADFPLDAFSESLENERRNVGSKVTIRNLSSDELERFTESTLRFTVRRELAWILNTTNLAAVEDLEAYPEVRTSVLNFGVSGLSGSVSTTANLRAREQAIRKAIAAFEPRLSEDGLDVVAQLGGNGGRVTFLIRGDITSTLSAVEFKAETEPDSETVTVRE